MNKMDVLDGQIFNAHIQVYELFYDAVNQPKNRHVHEESQSNISWYNNVEVGRVIIVTLNEVSSNLPLPVPVLQGAFWLEEAK